MKFGVYATNWGQLASKKAIREMALLAEEEGYDTCWLGDVIMPREEDREALGNTYEPLTTLAYLAADTSRIALGVAVLVLPLRNPIVVAKEMATIDVLSEGRTILGVGVGWREDEFRFLGADFHKRGRVLDEATKVLRILWVDDKPRFKGKYFNFTGGVFEPKPAQKDGIPIWVGGNSDAAIRRAATLGDAWHPSSIPINDFARGIRKLRKLTPPKRKVLASVEYRMMLTPGKKQYPDWKPDLYPQVLTGDARTFIKILEDLDELGLEHFQCDFGYSSLDDLRTQTRLFAREVMPSFK